MYESQIARLREIAQHLQQAQALYGEEPPPAPAGILLGADLTSAAARTQQLINHLKFLEKRAQPEAGKVSLFAAVRQIAQPSS